MKKFVVLMILLSVVSLAVVKVVPESTVVTAGDSLRITITLTDESGKPVKGRVLVEMSAGGFEDPDILIDGVEVDGIATIVYLAPNFETEAVLKFTHDDESTSLKVKVVEEEIEGEPVGVEVEEFGGNVAYREKDSDVWEDLKEGVVLYEGYEILTMKDSYVVLKFPNGALTRILSNTQVLIKRLVKVGEDSYVVKLEQKKGKTYNVLMRILKSGEKFEIETQSVTAGVRGTKFAVEVVGGETKIHTFEGTVFAYYRSGLVVPVSAGKTAQPDGSVKPLEKKEEDFEKPEEKKPTEEGKVEEKELPKTEASIPSVELGTQDKEGNKYLVYSISTDFTIGPVYLDVGITAYSTTVGGELYYGLPSSTPSTNILDAITINAVGLKIGNGYLRYGRMGIYTLGMGYTVRGYTAPFSNALDLNIGFGNFEAFLHLPYELRKISSFEIAQSDGIFIGDLRFHTSLPIVGETILSLGGLYDTQISSPSTDSIVPVEMALVLSMKRPIFSWLSAGVELSAMKGEDLMGFGAFTGFYGNVLNVNLTGGAYVSFNGFRPFLFDQSYYARKSEVGIYSDGRSLSGYLLGGEFDWSWSAGRIYLYGSFGGDPTLEGDLKVSIPSFGAFQGLYLSGYVYDPTPLKGVLDEDTNVWLKITYPIVGSDITGGLMFYWDTETLSWKQSIIIGSEEWGI